MKPAEVMNPPVANLQNCSEHRLGYPGRYLLGHQEPSTGKCILKKSCWSVPRTETWNATYKTPNESEEAEELFGQ